MSPITQRRRIEVRGTVQGVGFRPFVYRLAARHNLTGWVRNHSGGVEIEVEGMPAGLESFSGELRIQAPPLARIDALTSTELPATGASDFTIRESCAALGELQPVPPDTAPCADCRRELFDPMDRRHGYPFLNCTNCGPRFTIIEALPYDRPRTTMQNFPLCSDCAREYNDPLDRRFHAQPVACPACGPRLWLETPPHPNPLPGGERTGSRESGAESGDSAAVIAAAVDVLRQGQILAVKGLGGFHLACDARNETAVAMLRERKRRGAKPFAVMFADLAAVQDVCAVSSAEEDLLLSPRRPIVLLRIVDTTPDLAPSVAPGLAELGVMLPSTPLHELLLRAFGGPLVMTSGNLSEEPIAAMNDEARTRLDGLADGFLFHDREIASRYDDSVVRVVAGRDEAPAPSVELLIRRARGYAPAPLQLPFAARRSVLACGAHLKNTFCLLKDRYAFLSQHVGDLENLETLEHFRATLTLYQRLFAVEPEIVAHDLHPEYLSTKLARELPGVEQVAVQHHHAHIVSCLAEHGIAGPAIGVAYDGLGYGTDGRLWGGEILVADWGNFERRAHLREAPMPGGALAIRRPYRMALGYLVTWFQKELTHFEPFLQEVNPVELAVLRRQVERSLNAPLTSSCGRLFDAVSALLGICRVAQYEAQAALELEAMADPAATGSYPYGLAEEAGTWIIDPAPVVTGLYQDRLAGVPIPEIAGRFHRSVADFTVAVCRRLSTETGLKQVALGGGVFQNTLLLRLVVKGLERAGLAAYFNRQIPANDGGIAYGQAIIAHHKVGISHHV